MPDEQPRFHVRAASNWINDPNGPIHHDGTYHLFFQRNPRSADWGPPNWGHATSTDLVRWTVLDDALMPTPGGPDERGCWSGCCVAKGDEVYALYTGIDPDGEQVVCAAVSSGDLTKWRKHPEPVIAAPPDGVNLVGFRDPFVVPDGDGWLCVIGAGVEGDRGMVLLYRSDDLLNWTYVGPVLERDANERTTLWTGEMWECPQLFRLDSTDVLAVSVWNAQTTHFPAYFRGDFDGTTFTPAGLDRLDHGPDCYAPTSMVDPRGRRLMWGWSWEALDDEARRAAGLAGCLTVPREVTVRSNGWLRSDPIPELAELRGPRLVRESALLDGDSKPLHLADTGPSFDAEFDVLPGPDGQLVLMFCTSPDGREVTTLTLDAGHGTACLDTTRSSIRDDVRSGRYEAAAGVRHERPVHVRVLRDASVLEVFVDGTPFTARVYPALPESTGVLISSTRGKAELLRAEVWDIPEPTVTFL